MHYTVVHLISSHAVHVAVYHCKQISGLIDLPREVKHTQLDNIDGKHASNKDGSHTVMSVWNVLVHILPHQNRTHSTMVAHIPY